MHRYIAFAWNHQIADRNFLAKNLVRRLESTLPEWQCALAADGLQVYQTGQKSGSCQAYILNRNGGVVLGKVFVSRMAGDCDPGEVEFTDQETQKIQETDGRHLIEHYWGRYVALLREDCSIRVRVLRDPTGAVPCLLIKFRGIHVICSHIDDCATLGLVSSSINWDHIAAFLWFDRLVTADMGLDGVRQIHAGECVAVDSDRTKYNFCWSPNRIHSARVVEDRQQAMRELRNVIQHCVGAWASCYSSILHCLSGGLDSAVVLACLSRTSGEAKIICQNLFTPAAQGDERVFAQKSADREGIDLIETGLRSSETAIESMFDCKRLASPAMTYPVTESDLVREKILKQNGIEAVFSGQGGDHYFQQARTLMIAADYARHHGLRFGVVDVIADTSRFTRRPIWSVMAAVFAYGLLHRHEDPYVQRLNAPTLLSDATRDALNLSSLRHPWVISASELPAGKVRQIVSIIDAQNFYLQGLRNYAEIVHPLISQPIIELCLQIPSYVLTYGGIDRALVRDAFSEFVPREITTRTTKGATTSYANGVLVENLPYIRELLLNGLLVGETVLDRKKIEVNLRESHLIRDSSLYWPVLSAIRAETWLRTWLSEGRRAAA